MKELYSCSTDTGRVSLTVLSHKSIICGDHCWMDREVSESGSKNQTSTEVLVKQWKMFLAGLFMLVFSTQAFAVNFIAGAKAGYYEWDPWIKNIDMDILDNIDTGSGVLYGPVLSLMITPDMSFSMSALFGIQKVHWYSERYDYTHYLGPSLSTSTAGYADYHRTDIDAAFSYSPFQNFRIFAGYKYQSIDIIIKSMVRRSENGADTIEYLELGEYEISTPAHGPAIGIGGTYAFGNNYFVSANLSGLYMWGLFEVKKLDTIQYDATTGNLNDPVPVDKGKPGTLDIQQIGINLEPTVGKSTDNGKIIFTLGIRYQLLRTNFVESNPNFRAKDEWMNDQIYGIFVSVLLVL